MGKSIHKLFAPFAWADYVVDLPKLKTHGMTTVSAGVKNLFGLVPGLQKPALHCRFPREREFAGMLLDLAEHRKEGYIPLLSVRQHRHAHQVAEPMRGR